MNISPNTKPVQTTHVCYLCVLVWIVLAPLSAVLSVWGVATLWRAFSF